MTRCSPAPSKLVLGLVAVLVGCSPYYGDMPSPQRRQLDRAIAVRASGDLGGACAILAEVSANTHPGLLIQHARCLLDPDGGDQDLVAARAVLERVFAMRSRYRGRAALMLADVERRAGGTPQAQLAWLDRAQELGEPGTERPRLKAWQQDPDNFRTELVAAYRRRAPADPYSALELARLTAADPAADPALRQARIGAAVRALQAGAEAGGARYARTLSWLYDSGELVSADPDEAFLWLSRAARAGDGKALTKLADRARAEGDLAAAQRLLREAVAAGSQQAAVNLSRGYLAGRFEPVDATAAAELIARTAEAGGPPALRVAYAQALLRGGIVARDPARGLAMLEELAATGDGPARTELGRRLLRGLDVPADPARGRALLEGTAAAGDAGAMFHLARAFLYGHGVRADPPLGIDWLRRAADSGSAGAETRTRPALSARPRRTGRRRYRPWPAGSPGRGRPRRGDGADRAGLCRGPGRAQERLARPPLAGAGRRSRQRPGARGPAPGRRRGSPRRRDLKLPARPRPVPEDGARRLPAAVGSRNRDRVLPPCACPALGMRTALCVPSQRDPAGRLDWPGRVRHDQALNRLRTDSL